MTLKQQRFVKEYISNGGNSSQAALKVYDVKPEIARSMGSENLAKPDIKQAIESALSSLDITPSSVAKEINNLATKNVEKISGDVKLKANIELLKLMGAYPGSKHTNINIGLKGNVADMNFADVKKELKVIDSELADSLGEESEDTSPIIEQTTDPST